MCCIDHLNSHRKAASQPQVEKAIEPRLLGQIVRPHRSVEMPQGLNRSRGSESASSSFFISLGVALNIVKVHTCY